MTCVPAKACKVALSGATAKWPNRNRASDGICGDESHQARTSDHNQGNAFDLTHDPANGVDCHVHAETATKDTRVKYVIWNRRIWNPSVSQSWRSYSGSNPHTKHMHVSIKPGSRDDVRPWWPDEGVDMPLSDADIQKVALATANLLLSQGYLGTANHHMVSDAGRLNTVVKDVKTLLART